MYKLTKCWRDLFELKCLQSLGLYAASATEMIWIPLDFKLAHGCSALQVFSSYIIMDLLKNLKM